MLFYTQSALTGLLLMLAINSSIHRQTADQGFQADSGQTLRAGTSLQGIKPAMLLEDFQIARKALEEGHPGIYRYTLKAEMDRIFETAAKSLDRSLTTDEFYRLLAPVIAAVKCGHTGLYLTEAITSQLNNQVPVLPAQVRVLNGKVYVFRDFTKLAGEGKRLTGKEISSINGIPVSVIIARMMAATPGDGDALGYRQLMISGWNFNRLLISLTELTSPYTLTIKEAGSKHEQKITVEGVLLTKLRAAYGAEVRQVQQSAPAAELKLLDEGKLALMTIRSFSNTSGQQPLGEFYKEAFTKLRSQNTEALILDLRNNGGGNDDLGMLLLSYLLDRPFKYYEDLLINATSFSFEKYSSSPVSLPPFNLLSRLDDGRLRFVDHPNWGLRQPSAPIFPGKVFILMNGGSFSTTAEFLSQAHFHRRALFIGEESGGNYYGNTSGTSARIRLPHSNLRLHVPLVGYYMAVSGYQQKSRGVMPDHAVEYSIAELLAGVDKELALGLRIARGH